MTWSKINKTSPDYFFEIARGNIAGKSSVQKYGRNPDIDTGSGFEAIWNGGGDYTGHDCVVAEILTTVSSSALDAGTLVSSGVATGGTATTLIDTEATFVSDGVQIGDVFLDDTQLDHAIITGVTETILSFLVMNQTGTPALLDSYRIVTKASTGSPVIKLGFLLDGNFDNETSEYVILNGVTPVDTLNPYIRHSRGKAIGGNNAGAITTKQKITTANITMVMPIGYNSTMIAAYTIPASVKRGYFVKVFASIARKKDGFSNVRLMVRPVNDVFQVAEEFTLATTGTSFVVIDFKVPKNDLMPMTDIKIMADSSANDMGIAAGFDIVKDSQ